MSKVERGIMAKITKAQEIDIDKIIPYENNALIHSEYQVKKIADSIKEFGFLNPCLIDKNYNLIAGHGRVEGAKLLGLKTIPCIFIEGLTEPQKRAYILADNKLGELAEWDEETLESELEALKSLDFDTALTGFDDVDLAPIEEESEEDDDVAGFDPRDPSCQHNAFENQDLRQYPTVSWYGMPNMKPTNTVGDKMLRFMDWRTVDEDQRKQYIAHFYYDDYKFINAWRNPEKYIDRLKEFKAVVSPDFSLYTDFPRALQILSCYRRQWCGAFWQEKGLDVIPDVVWGDHDSYEYCFDGIPIGGTVAVSTVGVRNNKTWNGKEDNLFLDGYNEMLKRLKPSTIIVYGSMIEGLEGNIISVPSYYMEKAKIWKENRKNKEK